MAGTGPSRAEAWRLFIASPLPDPVRVDLDARLAPYRRAHPTVRWLAPATWHLTLLFLGQVAVGRVGELVGLLGVVCTGSASFRVAVTGGGGRVCADDGIAWLRVGEGAAAFIDLADRLAAACPPEATPGRQPSRAPSAHLTVARRADPALVASLRAERHGPLRTGWQVARVALMRSRLGPAGASYETLHEVPMYAGRG
jgi:2'-5' RNA ligase